MAKITKIIEDDTAGDPMTGLRWTRKTTKKIATELSHLGINVSPTTVRLLLKKSDFSLKTNRKTIISGGKKPPDYLVKRDRQFLNIKAEKAKFKKSGNPIISVDTKKKELVGNFKNNGRVWARKFINVRDHDFRSDARGMAVPYGIYDVNGNKGHVVIGRSKDTPAFATDAIEEWWRTKGRVDNPNTTHLLILADGGGSNSSRSTVWKKDLQEKLSNQYNLTLTVCHYPPGASKWNPIEHRLFSEISKNWAGVPLRDYKTIKNFITTTTTNSGLKVTASHNTKIYFSGEHVPKDAFSKLNCHHSKILPQWNYTIYPNSPSSIN